MSRRSSVAAAALLALTALFLAGCTPASATHRAATPKSTPTPVAAQTETQAAPSTRFLVLCPDLVDAAALGDGLSLIPQGPPTWPAGVAAEQAGMLDCVWGDPSKKPTGDTGVDPAITITAVPDSGSAGRKQIEAMLSASYGQAVDGHIGDASAVQCAVQGGFTCRASVVKNDTWLFVGLYGTLSKVTTDSVEAARAVIEHVASSALERLGKPAKKWHAPATPWAPPGECSAESTDPSTVVGGGAGAWHNWNRPGDDDSARMYAGYESGWMTNCVWGRSSDPGGALLTMQVVADGGWVWDRLSDQEGITSTAVDVAGADKAEYRCDTADGFCHLDVVARGNWIQLEFLTSGVPDESTKLAKLAAVVIASKA